ncbi:MAG TPA: hypothetical protein VFE08_04150 [Candidatus Sulfotelmatobacter sp.]|nr:hypothetical protein [Candidatus Sulfotelmatobacter sp.]
MKSQEIRQSVAQAWPGPITPSEAPVPHKVVDQRAFHRTPCGRQVTYVHCGKSRQHAQLNCDADPANE